MSAKRETYNLQKLQQVNTCRIKFKKKIVTMTSVLDELVEAATVGLDELVAVKFPDTTNSVTTEEEEAVTEPVAQPLASQ